MLNTDLQNFIFHSPDRASLMNYVPQSTNSVKIGIYRNHSFELVEHTISSYLDFADITAEFIYSDYDDSLSFFQLDSTVDLLILWLDLNRYQTPDILSFLKERIAYLKTIYKKPIIAAFLTDTPVTWDFEVVTYSFEKFRGELGDHFYNLRLEKFSGTRMSSELCMLSSKDLGLNYIPALLSPGLKGIIVDLDNTLYRGVLGEDGYQNLDLTSGHALLQEKLKELKKQGFFLGIVSKNEQEDVIEMFSKRTDFPLQLDDFDKIICSWNKKGDSIHLIATYLHISVDSLLFIDDNPGELISVNQQLPQIKCLLAQENAIETLEVLNNYPGLLKLHHEYEDSIRSSDLNANTEREALRSQLTEQDYIRSLKICLTYHINDKKQISRISELANKTNQFIFNYKRYSNMQIQDLMSDPDSAIIAVELSDRLSDSGIIGVCVARKEQDVLNVEEFFISCRALGRGIDALIIKGALDIAARQLGTHKLRIQFQRGERNLPAEQFINEHLKEYKNTDAPWTYQFPENLVTINIKGD